MNEEDRANALDRILSKRLQEISSPYPPGLPGVFNRAIRGIRKRLGGKPEPEPSAPWQWEVIARIRSLPAHMQDPLRRYLVFREAEESICQSINTTPAEFRRFLRDAAGYILMRHDRMPELGPKQDPEGTSRDRQFPPG